MGLLITKFRRTAIVMALYGIALAISVSTTGIALVAPFSFVVTCFSAWDMGLLMSLAWVSVVHVVVPCLLTVAGTGPFFLFPEARGLVGTLILASTMAYVILAFLAVRLRSVTEDVLKSKAAMAVANEMLQSALDEVRELRGFLPICAWCKDVRDISGSWEKIESYIARHSRATFTHGLCPKCLQNQPDFRGPDESLEHRH